MVDAGRVPLGRDEGDAVRNADGTTGVRGFKLISANPPRLSRPYTVNWIHMGLNYVGTTFIGADNEVQGVKHVIQAMKQHGPGLSIAGGHGWIDGSYISDPALYLEDVAHFGYTNVVDMNLLLPQDIRILGGPGQRAYLNWCYSAFCTIVLENLNLSK